MLSNRTKQIRGMRAGLLCALLSASVLACTERSPVLVVRDSSGVRIIEAPSQFVTSLPSLAIPIDSPIINLGGTGPYGERFISRVADAFRTGDGSIVVANGASGEMLVFDSSGTLRHSIGRRGEGPGEFQDISLAAQLNGDTIAVYDGLLRRVSVFTKNGSLVRSMSTVVPGISFPDVRGIFPDGSLLTISLALPPERTRHGVYRDTIAFYRVLDSELKDTLGTYPGDERLLQPVGRGGVSFTALPFGKRLQVAANDSLVFIGSGDSYQILAMSRNGPLRMIIRTLAAPVLLTPPL